MVNNENVHFDEQDKVGDEGVASLREHLSYRGYGLEEAPKCYHPEWDARAFDEVGYYETYECKREPMATGIDNRDELQRKYQISRAEANVHPERTFANVFVEFADVKQGVRRKSGIALSESDFYWFDNPAGVFKVPTDTLRDIMRNPLMSTCEFNGQERFSGIPGGNDGTARGCLVPIDVIREFETTIN